MKILGVSKCPKNVYYAGHITIDTAVVGETGGIKMALENTPPELSADLVDMGLTLTGGGALLKNIDRRFSKETGLPVHIAEDPFCLLYTSPSPRDRTRSRMPSSA